MLNVLRMRLAQVAELVQANGWKSLFGELFFLRRTAVVVEKDLSEVTDRSEPLASARLKVLEIDKDMLFAGAYRFAVGSRYLKAVDRLNHGYGAYALAKGKVIVGDTWHFVSGDTDNPRVLHEDLQNFGFKNWKGNEIYTFDIYVAPGERKGGVSAAFQNSAMLGLRAKGYKKAYGFYWADNVAAQWCTRVTNRWKEVRAYSVSRFLIFKRVVLLRKDKAPHKKASSRPTNLSKNLAIEERGET